MQENSNLETGTLLLTVDGKTYEWNKQYITGAELRQLAGVAQEQEIYMALTEPWDDELITDETPINLARPGIENFFVKRDLDFFINGVSFKSNKQNLKGKNIRKMGNISDDEDLFLQAPAPYADELIDDKDIINLARPGVEYFISKEKPFSAAIIVNGRPKEWPKRKISFGEVIVLAFGSDNITGTAYTVTYSKGPKQNQKGTMVRGDEVYVQDKMNFNATATDKS